MKTRSCFDFKELGDVYLFQVFDAIFFDFAKKYCISEVTVGLNEFYAFLYIIDAKETFSTPSTPH